MLGSSCNNVAFSLGYMHIATMFVTEEIQDLTLTIIQRTKTADMQGTQK